MSRRNALAGYLVFRVISHRLRRRAADTGGDSVAPKKGHRLRNLLVVGALTGAAVHLWRRFRGSDDDGWTTYQPASPAETQSGNGSTGEVGATVEPEQRQAP